MYHFPTKEKLLLSVVEHLVDGYERQLTAHLDGALEQATSHQRISAYLAWALRGGFDRSDLAVSPTPAIASR